MGTEGVENGQSESTSSPAIPAWDRMLVVAFFSVLSVLSPLSFHILALCSGDRGKRVGRQNGMGQEAERT